MKTLGSNNSPVDTLAINYIIRFLVNNLLTWVAAVKAALSVWTIWPELPLPPPSALPQEEDDKEESPKESTSDEEPVEGGVKLDARAASLTLPVPPAATVCVTKGRRFTMCFFEDDCCRENEAASKEEEAAAMEVDGGRGSGEWWCAWERVLRETSGETGWYRCQDLSLLDGSVVRLWDDRHIKFNNNN